MPTITEQAAQRYAAAVVEILARHFPDLSDGNLRQAVRNDVAEHAMEPDEWFERTVTFTRAWRLHPGDIHAERRRVHLVSHKNNGSARDMLLVESVNDLLRAIKLED